MGLSFENIPCIVWGCGDGRYGDENAKEKAIKLMKKERYVFVDLSVLRDHAEQTFARLERLRANQKSTLFNVGCTAYAVPSKTAVQLLENFPLTFFNSFMLRDVDRYCSERPLYLNIHNHKVHLVLDFDGYGKGERSDHFYD